MNLKRGFMIAFAIISIMVVQSCNDSDNNEDGTARVQLKLIDSPGDYLEVNVNIIDVQYNSAEDEDGWRSFESFVGPVDVNLLELVGGVSLFLTDENLPSGMMKQIRLILGDGNYIVIDGDDKDSEEDDIKVDLTTPSAQQSGLKLKLDTELEAGFSYTFILDWDVQKSIVETGSGKYILKPVIRVEAEVNSGSIEGIVTGEAIPLEDVVVYLYKSDAVEGEEPFASTSTIGTGYFIFEGLSPSNYEIEIEQDGYSNYKSGDITVKVGEVQDISPIEL
ncbi:MAG: DUF4382 domain-containing protein [Bacteroidetes bacterium]|nr:DUF4382 domain-containing protein [Bacteroidota bacterium]